MTLHQRPQIPGSDDFLPNFYPKGQRSGIEMLYLLVTVGELEWPAGVCDQPSKLVMRVRFPSPTLD
jgi:hypothetical protein